MGAYLTTAKQLSTFGTTEFGMPFFEAVLRPRDVMVQQFQEAYRAAVQRSSEVHEALGRSITATDPVHRFYSNKRGLSDSDLNPEQLYALLGPDSRAKSRPSRKTHYAHHSSWRHEGGKHSKALSVLRREDGILNLSTRVALYLGAPSQPLKTDELVVGLNELGVYIPQRDYWGLPRGPDAVVSEIVCDFVADLWFYLLEWNPNGVPQEDNKRRKLHKEEEGHYIKKFAGVTDLVTSLMETKD